MAPSFKERREGLQAKRANANYGFRTGIEPGLGAGCHPIIRLVCRSSPQEGLFTGIPRAAPGRVLCAWGNHTGDRADPRPGSTSSRSRFQGTCTPGTKGEKPLPSLSARKRDKRLTYTCDTSFLLIARRAASLVATSALPEVYPALSPSQFHF